MTRFLDLLLEFQALPRNVRERTFMEISRYPHYENVCSNILAFYFDPAEEHGLGDLFLTAFFEMVRTEMETRLERHGGGERFAPPSIPDQVKITREHPAEDQKRIDLLIDCETFTIGIENKIYHTEDNDFGIYSDTIDRVGDDKITVKAVLCLRIRSGEAELPGGFFRYTYSEFWKHVLDRLGHRLPSASPKWITYLSEFMTTTARLAGESAEEKEVTDFFIKNRVLIEKLLAERQALLDRLDGYNSTLLLNLKAEFEVHESITKVSIHAKSAFAVDFLIQGHTLVLVLDHWNTEWQIKVLSRDPHSPAFLRNFVTLLQKSEYPEAKINDSHWLLRTWDLHATQVELQNAVSKTVDAFLGAISAVRPPEPSA